MNKFRKIVSIIISLLLILERSVVFSFAQEAAGTPTPTPTPTEELVTQTSLETETPLPTPTETPSDTTITDTVGVTNNVDSGADTGQNVIVEATPSPTPAPVTSEEPGLTSEESSTETPSPTPPPTSEIETGDAVAVANVENEVNTNIVNSEFVNHTLNIYLSGEVGDIDLNLLSQNAIAKVYGQDENFGEVVSIAAYSIDNFAYVENTITTQADTGENSVEGTQAGEISTGNAYSAVSLLNKINANVVDSQVHVITINIFGSLTGNIILPDSSAVSSEACCQATLVAENSAVVVNNVSSDATSGENTIMTSGGEAVIETGDAKSVVNVYNLVNTNIVNSYFNYFEINNMGEWSGSFLGWNEETGEAVQNSTCDSCVNDLTLGNSANVTNNVSGSANTGKNLVNGRGGKIKTGNAYSSISIVNFINTNIINSVGFVGFINIFGRLTGDIGGSEMFVEEAPPEPVVEEEVVEVNQSQEPNQKESGGILEVTHKTNVGTHVLPGDTVTFFTKTKNPGTGTVYGVKLIIELFKDGVGYGGATFGLGDIKGGKAVKLTTGLVLSKDAPGGQYEAKVSVDGIVGPDDHHVSASSESTFLILAYTPITGVASASENPPAIPEVLGDVAPTKAFDAYKWLKLYFYLLGFYIIAKGYQKREPLKSFALHLFSL